MYPLLEIYNLKKVGTTDMDRNIFIVKQFKAILSTDYLIENICITTISANVFKVYINVYIK